MEPQLCLFGGADDVPPRPRPRRRRSASRNERMAQRIDELVWRHERHADACRRAGDVIGERRAREEARDARRSAQILRAGPGGVADVMAA